MLSRIELVNSIVALLSIDFHALETDVRKEQQLRQKEHDLRQREQLLTKKLQMQQKENHKQVRAGDSLAVRSSREAIK